MSLSNSVKNHALLAMVIIIIFLAAVYANAHLKRPSSFILSVPFSTQAPNNNWYGNEDCEEASVTMANAYLTGDHIDKLPAEDAQRSIDTLKGWEDKNLGYNANTGADGTAKMAEGQFGLKVKQVKDFTEDDLKNALLGHHPILLPINARLLNNPEYLNNGPFYHMVVVRGYNEKGFMVNDPGTVDGEANVYAFGILKNSSTDWNEAAKAMDPNAKIALVLSR